MNIKTGSVIEVTGIGEQYPGYRQFYDANKTPECYPFVSNSDGFKNGTIGTVMAIEEHPSQEDLLLLINVDECELCFIIGAEGVKLHD